MFFILIQCLSDVRAVLELLQFFSMLIVQWHHSTADQCQSIELCNTSQTSLWVFVGNEQAKWHTFIVFKPTKSFGLVKVFPELKQSDVFLPRLVRGRERSIYSYKNNGKIFFMPFMRMNERYDYDEIKLYAFGFILASFVCGQTVKIPFMSYLLSFRRFVHVGWLICSFMDIICRMQTK